MTSFLLAAAMLLTEQSNPDDALRTLSLVNPSKQEAVQYYFIKMSAYFALNQKEEAKKFAELIENSFEEVPVRYAILARMVLYDMEHWTEEDLGDIARDMRISKDRLANAKSGKNTQIVQSEIIRKLDKLIKQQEDAANAAQQDANKGQDGRIGQEGNQSNKPLEESIIALENGKGKVDEKTLKTLVDNWGTMPEKMRARAIMAITKDLPARYRVLIEEFEKSLANTPKK